MSTRTLWAHPPGTSALRARRQATKTPMTFMCRRSQPHGCPHPTKEPET